MRLPSELNPANFIGRRVRALKDLQVGGKTVMREGEIGYAATASGSGLLNVEHELRPGIAEFVWIEPAHLEVVR